MSSSSFILGLLCIHFVSDFIFQKQKDAENKSKNFSNLLNHVLDYFISTVFLLILLIFISGYNVFTYINQVIVYTFILSVLHLITDFITSRVNAYSSKNGNTKGFWVGIGADQLLHQIQIIILYEIFLNGTF